VAPSTSLVAIFCAFLYALHASKMLKEKKKEKKVVTAHATCTPDSYPRDFTTRFHAYRDLYWSNFQNFNITG